MDLRDLIDKIENAPSPNRLLDAMIECELRRFQAYDAGLNDKQRADWKPIGAKGEVQDGPTRYHAPAYTFQVDAALRLLPVGFYWRGGKCGVSSEALVCPDHNGEHGERLMRECPPSEVHWDEGIEVELRPGSDTAFVLALVSACLRAHEARHPSPAASAHREYVGERK